MSRIKSNTAGVDGRIASLRQAHRLVDKLSIALRNAGRAGINSVHGKTDQDLAQRVAQHVEGEIPRLAMLFRNMVQTMCEHLQLAGHRHAQDEPLAVVRDRMERRGLAGRAGVIALQLLPAIGRQEQPIAHLQEIVPRRSSDRP